MCALEDIQKKLHDILDSKGFEVHPFKVSRSRCNFFKLKKINVLQVQQHDPTHSAECVTCTCYLLNQNMTSEITGHVKKIGHDVFLEYPEK